MKRYVFLVAFALIMFITYAYAGKDMRTQLAEELLVLTGAKENIERYSDIIRQVQMDQLKNISIPGEESKEIIALQEKITKMIKKEMSWNNLKKDYIDIYAETFAEEELRGIIKFYKTPVGKKFIEKQPELMQKSVQISQKKINALMPKIQQLTMEAIDTHKESEKETQK